MQPSPPFPGLFYAIFPLFGRTVTVLVKLFKSIKSVAFKTKKKKKKKNWASTEPHTHTYTHTQTTLILTLQ